MLSKDEEDVLINTGLTNLLSAISERTKFIFISSDGVFTKGEGDYTESDHTLPVTEGTPLSTYINSKIKGEKKVQYMHSNYTIIRTGPLYGNDLNQNIEQRTKRVLRKIGGNSYSEAATNLYKTFVHVDDLSKAI
ncbi:sugar nucleotide-binding protein, partial [Alkalibacillus haloalkaliphilus]|uniref:sugar nucleotide-binding protein n=1 Tax=Alkalibacillus haloalkaliphilus TaxID=94136 RepID=UPI000367E42A